MCGGGGGGWDWVVREKLGELFVGVLELGELVEMLGGYFGEVGEFGLCGFISCFGFYVVNDGLIVFVGVVEVLEMF